MGVTSTRLSRLLEADREPDALVAWRWDPRLGRDVAIRWGDFVARVEAVAERVSAVPPGAIVLACDDRYAFAVGLFGAWRAGRLVLAPPNAQPDTIARLADRAVGVLTDRPDFFGPSADVVAALEVVAPLDVAVPAALAPTPASPRGLDRAAEALELYTSGTTGDGKATLKLLAHLEEEVAYLDGAWRRDFGEARMLSTASHQHLYGLLFGLLLPLCSGRAFQADTLIHAAELIPRMVASGRCVLASVPSHLRRMVAHRDAPLLAKHCVATISSGGPLDEETADRWRVTVGAPPIECFGSTETGGVAWRRQWPGEERMAWTPFDVVQCEQRPDDGCLRVLSRFFGPLAGSLDRATGAKGPLAGSLDRATGAKGPLAGSLDSEGFTMGDRVRFLPDGRFILEGRQDRVVKVGEKRVSLPLMEQHLCAHRYVADAALLVLDHQGDARLGAVIAPSEAGVAFEEASGRRALFARIADHLARSWDRVLLPRVWRTVAQLPENELGKVTSRSLRALFASPDAPRTPRVVDERCEADRIEQRCRVPEDLAQAEGHFPGRPIVPGVVQLQWAIEVARRIEPALLHVELVEALKFRSLLRPGDEFELSVERVSESTFSFRLCADTETISSGRLRFAGEQRA